MAQAKTWRPSSTEARSSNPTRDQRLARKPNSNETAGALDNATRAAHTAPADAQTMPPESDKNAQPPKAPIDRATPEVTAHDQQHTQRRSNAAGDINWCPSSTARLRPRGNCRHNE
eukprot:GHVU01200407.1.p3 GENE.GHVU01200407.1~~GHVU01200407.1.p3  ORF type:complete len:116 (-),score=9.84 GHVU01200407.1:60-407(-)